MEFHSQLGKVRRWLPWLVIGVILAAVPAYVLTSRQPYVYEATTTMLPGQLLPESNPNFNDLSIARLVGLSLVHQASATSPSHLNNVIQALGLQEDAERLARRVLVSVDQNTGAMSIYVQDGDAAQAAAIANAVAAEVERSSSPNSEANTDDQAALAAQLAALVDRINEADRDFQTLLAIPQPTLAEEQALARTVQLLNELRLTYESLAASVVRGFDGLRVLEPAAIPTAAVAPRPLYYTILAAVMGLLVVAGIAFLVEFMNTSIKDPKGVRQATGLATLGTIERRRRFARGRAKFRLATLRDPGSAAAESYLRLRANVDFAAVDMSLTSLLITSSGTSEGKTATAANVAVAFAQAGRRVVLIDADLRNPALHTLFGLTNQEGLSSLLRDEAVPLENVAHAVGQDNLLVLTSGPSPALPAEQLGAPAMERLVDRLLQDHELLVFDSPPLGVAVDAAVIGAFASGTLLVIDAAHTSRAALVGAVEALDGARANILGAVLYRAARGTQSDYQGYSRSVEVPATTHAVESAEHL